jgi:hypothetical protein
MVLAVALPVVRTRKAATKQKKSLFIFIDPSFRGRRSFHAS